MHHCPSYLSARQLFPCHLRVFHEFSRYPRALYQCFHVPSP